MKNLFLFSVLATLLMWIAALATIPIPREDRETIISWSTDPNPARKTQIAKFEDKYPTVGVTVEPETFEKTIVQCSTGVGPDLIEMYTNIDMASYAEAGILLDLTPYAEEYGFPLSKTWPKLHNNLQYNGRMYRFPANAASNVLFYNKAIFREAGLPEPRNGMGWNEFIDLVQPLTKQKENGAYERFALAILRGFVPEIPLQHGGKFFSDDLTSSALDSPGFIEGMNLYRDLMREYNIIPTPATADALAGGGGWGTGEIDWFRSGRAATLWGSRWMMVLFREEPELHKNIGVVTLPRPPGAVSTSYSYARGPGINANTENLEEALNFLAYLASEEYNEIIALGSDALPPNRVYGSDPDNLLNPEYPNEGYQEVFIQSMREAEPKQLSPFIDAKVSERIWTEALDYIDNDLKSPEAALTDAANRINGIIRNNLRNRESLRERYAEIKDRPYSDDQPLQRFWSAEFSNQLPMARETRAKRA